MLSQMNAVTAAMVTADIAVKNNKSEGCEVIIKNTRVQSYTLPEVAVALPEVAVALPEVVVTLPEVVVALPEVVAVALPEVVIEAAQKDIVVKKYRAAPYDIHDKTYATELSEIFKREPAEVQAAFNEFTDDLMLEPAINRFSLLTAIDEYQASDANKEFPVGVAFQNMAFNCRPYQACVIC